MRSFAFYCPICGYYRHVPFTLAGKCTTCPGCKKVVPLPIRKTIQEETVNYLMPRAAERASVQSRHKPVKTTVRAAAASAALGTRQRPGDPHRAQP